MPQTSSESDPRRSEGSVLVASAHRRVSEGLRDWLQTSFDAVFLMADCRSLVDGARRLPTALVVVDLALAEGRIAALLSDLHRAEPGNRVLVLSDLDDARADAATLEAGATDVVHKATLAADLAGAADRVLSDRRYPPPAAR